MNKVNKRSLIALLTLGCLCSVKSTTNSTSGKLKAPSFFARLFNTQANKVYNENTKSLEGLSPLIDKARKAVDEQSLIVNHLEKNSNEANSNLLDAQHALKSSADTAEDSELTLHKIAVSTAQAAYDQAVKERNAAADKYNESVGYLKNLYIQKKSLTDRLTK